DVMEIIRAEHMPPETPAMAVALLRHLHGAEADRTNRTGVPTQVMQTRRRRFQECEQMMIASMHRMHEADSGAGTVGEFESQSSAIEIERPIDIAGESQHMRKSLGLHFRDFRTARRVGNGMDGRRIGKRRLRVW